MTKIAALLLPALASVFLAAAGARAMPLTHPFGEPVFTGTRRAVTASRPAPFATHGLLGFMTAAEMKERLASLTGFQHPAFDLFADVLGRYDPASGTRTNDRPTLVTILFMRRITGEIADAVVAREAFLDDDERIDFRGVDFAAAATEESLDQLSRGYFAAWLGYEPNEEELSLLRTTFHAARDASAAVDDTGKNLAGYSAFLALALQNGGLFYY